MSAKPFAMKLAATVAYNQTPFYGRKLCWFRALCDDLGWEISETFATRWIVSLFVVCCDPELLEKTINESWHKTKDDCKEAMKKAVLLAEKKKTVKYPLTLKLFKSLFPTIL